MAQVFTIMVWAWCWHVFDGIFTVTIEKNAFRDIVEEVHSTLHMDESEHIILYLGNCITSARFRWIYPNPITGNRSQLDAGGPIH